jgi:hypothetical protein
MVREFGVIFIWLFALVVQSREEDRARSRPTVESFFAENFLSLSDQQDQSPQQIVPSPNQPKRGSSMRAAAI